MLSLALRSKAAYLLITAAVAAGGTVGGVLLTRHQEMLAAASVPLPAAPPSGTPGTVTPDNAQALAPTAPPAYAPVNSPAYNPTSVPQATPAPVVAPAVQVALSPAQLDQLLGPVALYPDPLIAEILPASTYPDQLAAAALWLRYNPAPPEYTLQSQPWEPSIQSLAHSPSVLIWMVNNPDWTRTLGTAFTYQPQDVMNSIQRLRALALASGSLHDTPQQVIVQQDRIIYIEPAVTDVLYVPVYDWRTCYWHRDEPSFFVAAHIGDWLDNDCDWDDAFITVGARWDQGWDHRWDHDRDARRVTVRTGAAAIDRPRTGDSAVNTPGNRTTANTTLNTRQVNVGGTPWRRDDVRPAPTFPTRVAPAGKAQAIHPAPVVTPHPTPSLQPNPDHGTTPDLHPDRGNADRGSPGRGNADRGRPATGPGSDHGRPDRGNGRGN